MKSNQDLIEEYLEFKKLKNCSKKYLQNLRFNLEHLNDSLSKPFKDTKEGDIVKILSKYKPSTVRVKLILYKSFYRHILNLDENKTPQFLKRIDIPNNKKDEIAYRERVISPEEYDLLLNVSNIKHKAIIETLWNFGIRRSELISMNVSDVSFKDGMTTIIIRESKTETREVIIDGRSNFLLNWVEHFHQFKDEPKSPLFYSSNKSKKRFSTQGINKLIQDNCKKARIERNITPHDFRHTFVTRMLQKTKPTHVMTLAGFSKDTKMFSVYDHNKIDDYKNELKKKRNEIKPTYELLEKQKQTIEEKHEKEINEIKKTLNTFIKLYKSQNEEMDDLYKKEENLEETEDELFKSKTREKIYKEKLNIEEFETLKKLDLI